MQNSIRNLLPLAAQKTLGDLDPKYDALMNELYKHSEVISRTDTYYLCYTQKC